MRQHASGQTGGFAGITATHIGYGSKRWRGKRCLQWGEHRETGSSAACWLLSMALVSPWAMARRITAAAAAVDAASSSPAVATTGVGASHSSPASPRASLDHELPPTHGHKVLPPSEK